MKSKLIFTLVTAILYPVLAGGLAYLLASLARDQRQFDLSTSRKFGFSNDFNIQFRLLREEVVGNQPRDKVGKKIVNTTMSGMLYLTDVFEHIIDGLYESSFP